MPPDRLFNLPALEAGASAESILAARYQALGIAAESILIGHLLELGHRVAVPVTDDDGVDLIVNYTTKVQVKSSASRNADGSLGVSLTNRRSSERRGRGRHIRAHVDVLAIYARDARAWWFIPQAELAAFKGSRLRLAEFGPRSAWHEAWHVFDLAAAE
jgi:hypothetical protein